MAIILVIDNHKFFQIIIFHIEILFNETTCSKDAFMRGPGQMIVGLSFYGDLNATKSKKKGIGLKSCFMLTT